MFFYLAKGLICTKTEGLKTLFNIQSGRELSNEHTLLLEAGADYCSYAYWHRPSNVIDRLQFVSFDETEAEVRLAEILAELQPSAPRDVVFCAAFPQALLVPNKFFREEYSLLDAVYNQPTQAYFHDAIPEWQLVNLFAMPDAIYKRIQAAFGAVKLHHAYTPSLKVYNGYIADNQLLVHFTQQHFRVLLKKESSIQLAQTYAYKTPLDVVYFLLKICSEFALSQSAVHVILSGLVEKQSAMFTELQQYFANLHFAQPPALSLPDDSHPHHFFTSLYNLAACVS